MFLGSPYAFLLSVGEDCVTSQKASAGEAKMCVARAELSLSLTKAP